MVLPLLVTCFGGVVCIFLQGIFGLESAQTTSLAELPANTTSNTGIACYSPEDPNFSVSSPPPWIPPSRRCMTSWVEAERVLGRHTGLIHFYSDPYKRDWRPAAQPREGLIIGFESSLEADDCMMVVLSSRILSAMYNRNRRMYYPLLWRNEWRDTDTHQSSLLDNVATRHNVNDGFGELLRCAHEHRAGYKRIGATGALHLFVFRRGSRFYNHSRYFFSAIHRGFQGMQSSNESLIFGLDPEVD